VYTPAAGATTAVTGQVIQSAVWNSVHTDFSNALTTLGEAGALNPLAIIAYAHSVSLASVADAATLAPVISSGTWAPSALHLLNVGTVAPATIAYGLFTGIGATGTTVVPITSIVLSATTGVGAFVNTSPANFNSIVLASGNNIYFHVATVSTGGPVNVWLRGQILP
jgi:hypothetical protein